MLLLQLIKESRTTDIDISITRNAQQCVLYDALLGSFNLFFFLFFGNLRYVYYTEVRGPIRKLTLEI